LSSFNLEGSIGNGDSSNLLTFAFYAASPKALIAKVGIALAIDTSSRGMAAFDFFSFFLSSVSLLKLFKNPF